MNTFPFYFSLLPLPRPFLSLVGVSTHTCVCPSGFPALVGEVRMHLYQSQQEHGAAYGCPC